MDEQQKWSRSQFNKYMSKYTTLTLDEAYNIYIKQKWNKEEKQLMDTIDRLGLYRGCNPHIFRLMD